MVELGQHMAYVPDFQHDIYISYSHIDNQKFVPDGRGWVDQFVASLHALLSQYLEASAK